MFQTKRKIACFCIVAMGLLGAGLFSADVDSVQAQGKGSKPNIVEVDLKKLPPDLAKQLRAAAAGSKTDKQQLDELNKIQAEIDRLRARLNALEAGISPSTARPSGAWTGSIPVAKMLSKTERTNLAKVSSKEAKEAAAKAVKGGKAEDAELTVVNNYLVYKVEVIAKTGKKDREYDVIVDAGTGKVLSVKPDEDEDDAKKQNEKKGKGKGKGNNNEQTGEKVEGQNPAPLIREAPEDKLRSGIVDPKQLKK